jgi:DNA-binding MarR family transcriptional regulator
VPEPDVRAAVVDALRRVNIESDRFVEVFASAHGLHRTDLNAVAYIAAAAGAGHPMSPGQLGARLRLSSAATTALLDRLENVGHVTRERDPADRRRVVIRTQDQGMRLAGEFFAPLGIALDGLMDGFDTAELDTVRRFLERTVEVVEQVREDAAGG